MDLNLRLVKMGGFPEHCRIVPGFIRILFLFLLLRANVEKKKFTLEADI